MTRLATMGTSSCATLSISGWHTEDKKLQELYENGGYKYDPDAKTERGDCSLTQFGDKLLYPLSQPMGETYDYPFSLIMDYLDNVNELGVHKTSLGAKYIAITVSDYQHNADFWPPRLAERGFEKIDQTHNNAGELCHIYVRNTNRDRSYDNYSHYKKDMA